MEDGGAGGDNHSDRDSDKFGNGIVYAMSVRGVRKEMTDAGVASVIHIIV